MNQPDNDHRPGAAPRIWTVSEAKARLSEVLRRASEDGPQRIGTRRGYIVVSEEEWRLHAGDRPPLGQWLLDHIAPGAPLEPPDRRDPPRPDPFAEPG